jgi:hypothetical protein
MLSEWCQAMRTLWYPVILAASLLSSSSAWAGEPGDGFYSWRGFYIGASLGGVDLSLDRNLKGSSFWATGAGGTGTYNTDYTDAI